MKTPLQGRHSRRGPRAKLTPEQVRRLRAQAANGATLKELAQAAGIKERSVWELIHRFSYAWVK